MNFILILVVFMVFRFVVEDIIVVFVSISNYCVDLDFVFEDNMLFYVIFMLGDKFDFFFVRVILFCIKYYRLVVVM